MTMMLHEWKVGTLTIFFVYVWRTISFCHFDRGIFFGFTLIIARLPTHSFINGSSRIYSIGSAQSVQRFPLLIASRFFILSAVLCSAVLTSPLGNDSKS